MLQCGSIRQAAAISMINPVSLWQNPLLKGLKRGHRLSVPTFLPNEPDVATSLTINSWARLKLQFKQHCSEN